MDIGMLWFDNEKTTDLLIKVERAAAYYTQKYGQSPNLCFVHPDMISSMGDVTMAGNGQDNQVKIPEIEIRSMKTILLDHLWIGIDISPNERNANNHDEDHRNR